MKWNLEMEENFSDLEIISQIVKNKTTVQGTFEEGIYIRGRKMAFEKVSVLNERIQVYLPVRREQMNHSGDRFAYPQAIGEHEEYRCEDGAFNFTFEIYETNDMAMEDRLEEFKYGVQERYELTSVNINSELKKDGKAAGTALISGEVEEKSAFAYVYFWEDCRMYVFCSEENWEAVRSLAFKIFNEAEKGR